MKWRYVEIISLRCDIISKGVRPSVDESTIIEVENRINLPYKLGLDKSLLVLIQKYDELIEVQRKWLLYYSSLH